MQFASMDNYLGLEYFNGSKVSKWYNLLVKQKSIDDQCSGHRTKD